MGAMVIMVPITILQIRGNQGFITYNYLPEPKAPTSHWIAVLD